MLYFIRRKRVRKAGSGYNKGQGIIEYLIIFIIAMAGLLLLVSRVPGIFGNYVTNATNSMR